MLLCRCPLQRNSVLGGAECRCIPSVAGVSYGDVKVKSLEFGEAEDLCVEICFCEGRSETWHVDPLANGPPSFLENVTPGVDDVSVPVVTCWSAWAAHGMVIG